MPPSGGFLFMNAYTISNGTVFVVDINFNIIYSFDSPLLSVACSDYTSQEFYGGFMILHVPCNMTSWDAGAINVYDWIDSGEEE